MGAGPMGTGSGLWDHGNWEGPLGARSKALWASLVPFVAGLLHTVCVLQLLEFQFSLGSVRNPIPWSSEIRTSLDRRIYMLVLLCTIVTNRT